jgi:hypothetical protein
MRRVTLVPSVGGAFMALGACAAATQSEPGRPASAASRAPIDTSTVPPSPDPRIGLKAGWFDAGQAAWNMRLVGSAPPPAPLVDTVPSPRFWNSDLAFSGRYVIQGNFSGIIIWDVSDPARPRAAGTVACPSSQTDVAVHRNLLFVGSESNSARVDCGTQGVPAPVSPDRFMGVRIFDISDVRAPRLITGVQTCRGAHTMTLVDDESDRANVYVYVSGTSSRRSGELADCSLADPAVDPKSSLFTIDVIQVPLANPEQARVISRPPVLAGLTTITRHANSGLEAYANPAPGSEPHIAGPLIIACHDITVYTSVDLAGGACVGYGLLLDISDRKNPRRVVAANDTNFVAWHSATFNNDGTRVLFSDEWGSGIQPRCRETDNKIWGGDAIYRIEDRQRLTSEGYYKLPAPQPNENCVSHNGSLIPVPGRDILVQGWFSGGTSVVDWTDGANPKEIAFFDRGPMDATRPRTGGIWSAYWYNGHVYASDMSRGLDVLELQPSGLLSQNEIDAAKSVRLEQFNPQTQPKFVWPPTFALARAYLDQLGRSNGLAAERRVEVSRQLAVAETQQGATRREALGRLASQLEAAAPSASDAPKVRLLADAVRRLAAQ